MSYTRVKRAHSKSRSGCMTCKQRRVKCDETKPQCFNCQSRQIVCAYASQPVKVVPEPLSSFTRFTVSNIKSSISSENDTAEDRAASSFPLLLHHSSPIGPGVSPSDAKWVVHDSELARHYLEHTSHTLSSSSARTEQTWIWHVFIPSLAYVCSTIRQGMMTLGAMSLHFSMMSQGQSQSGSSRYLTTAIAHGEAFVEQSRTQLGRLDHADVDSNLASTRLLSVLAFAFLRQYRRDGIDLREERAWRWLYLLRGVHTVHTYLLTMEQNVHPAIKRDMMPDIFPGTEPLIPPIVNSRRKAMLAYIHRTRIHRFQKLYAAFHDGTLTLHENEHCNGLLAAIHSLARVTDHVCRWIEMSSLFRALCEWPGSLSEKFVHSLTRCHAPAMVIYAHWLMLVALADDLWWVGDMGMSGVRAVVKHIPKTDGKLLELIKEPVQLLEVDCTTA